MGAWSDRGGFGIGISIPLDGSLFKKKVKVYPFKNLDPNHVLSPRELALPIFKELLKAAAPLLLKHA